MVTMETLLLPPPSTKARDGAEDAISASAPLGPSLGLSLPLATLACCKSSQAQRYSGEVPARVSKNCELQAILKAFYDSRIIRTKLTNR
jgi:hypothetical protein